MTAQDPDEGLAVAELRIRYTLQPDGSDLVTVDASDGSGEVPPLLTMLGMLEMAKDSAVALAMADPGEIEYEEEDEDDDEYDEDA